MDITESYTYFSITSNGTFIDGVGLVGNDKSIFCPDEITNLLGIDPFRSWEKGDLRRNGSEYLFSSWSAEKSNKDRLNIESQCMETIKRLKRKVHILKEIKEKYDVNYCIMIVPHIFGEEQPYMSFNREIIEFCYLVDVTIEVDMYIYQDKNIET